MPLDRRVALKFALQRYLLVHFQGQNFEPFERCEKTKTLVVAASIFLGVRPSVDDQTSYEAKVARPDSFSPEMYFIRLPADKRVLAEVDRRSLALCLLAQL